MSAARQNSASLKSAGAHSELGSTTMTHTACTSGGSTGFWSHKRAGSHLKRWRAVISLARSVSGPRLLWSEKWCLKIEGGGGLFSIWKIQGNELGCLVWFWVWFGFRGRLLICSPGWPQTCSPPQMSARFTVLCYHNQLWTNLSPSLSLSFSLSCPCPLPPPSPFPSPLYKCALVHTHACKEPMKARGWW